MTIDNNKIDSFRNNVKKIIKVRNAGADMARIAIMYSIVHYILVYGRVIRKYNKYRELILMNIISFWNVSIFSSN